MRRVLSLLVVCAVPACGPILPGSGFPPVADDALVDYYVAGGFVGRDEHLVIRANGRATIGPGRRRGRHDRHASSRFTVPPSAMTKIRQGLGAKPVREADGVDGPDDTASRLVYRPDARAKALGGRITDEGRTLPGVIISQSGKLVIFRRPARGARLLELTVFKDGSAYLSSQGYRSSLDEGEIELRPDELRRLRTALASSPVRGEPISSFEDDSHGEKLFEVTYDFQIARARRRDALPLNEAAVQQLERILRDARSRAPTGGR